MINLPLVTIAIPSYNHQGFIGEAIKSAMNQTYKNIELVIIDDASTDNSQKIISKYSNNPKINKIILRKNNRGMTRTFNDCIKEANGEYILLLGSDDVLKNNIIKKQIKIFKKYPSVGMVHTGISIINEKGKIFFGKRGITFQRRVNLNKKCLNSIKFKKRDVIKRQIKNNYIHHPTSLVSKKCFNDVGLFDERFMFQDYEFWFRILDKYDIYYIHKPLLKYRYHTTNYSASNHYLNNKGKANEFLSIISSLSFNDSDLKKAQKQKIKQLKNHIASKNL